MFRTNGGSLGWGLPAAVGAKIACPDKAVARVVGDGTFHFTPQALWTAAREHAPVVTVVVDNSGYLAHLRTTLADALKSDRSTVLGVPVANARR